jgi:hypothetical protein
MVNASIVFLRIVFLLAAETVFRDPFFPAAVILFHPSMRWRPYGGYATRLSFLRPAQSMPANRAAVLKIQPLFMAAMAVLTGTELPSLVATRLSFSNYGKSTCLHILLIWTFCDAYVHLDSGWMSKMRNLDQLAYHPHYNNRSLDVRKGDWLACLYTQWTPSTSRSQQYYCRSPRTCQHLPPTRTKPPWTRRAGSPWRIYFMRIYEYVWVQICTYVIGPYMFLRVRYDLIICEQSLNNF